MSKDEISFKNRDRFIQLGIAISSLRKMRGMSQEQLAEKANISRSHLSAIEAPNMVRAFSMEAFLNIADALDVAPDELIQIAFLQDRILKRNCHLSRVNAQKSKNIFYEARMRAISSRKSCSEHR